MHKTVSTSGSTSEIGSTRAGSTPARPTRMKILSLLAVSAALAGTMLAADGRHAAAATLCSAAGAHPDGLSVSNMTLDGSPADDCYGVLPSVTGSPSESMVNTAFGSLYGGGGFTLLSKDEEGGSPDGSPLNGFSFDISANAFDDTDTYMLSWTGGIVPAFFDFVFGLKAGPDAALYLFDDFAITVTPSGENGTYAIAFTNPGGNIPDLSNITLFGRIGTGDTTTPPTPNPEPATLALLGGGLIGLGVAARRRRERGTA